MIEAKNVAPGMQIAFDIMGNTVCIEPHDVKVNSWTCEFRSETTHRIVVEPCTMVEVLSYPVPEPSIIGSRVLVGGRAFLLVQSAAPNSSVWVDIVDGSRYTWAMLRDRFGVPTILEDNPRWTVDSRKTEPETVGSLDDANSEMVYADKDGDLWVYEESASDCWHFYKANDGVIPSSWLQPFEPVARKVNK